jgi:hypothetical protein
MNGWNHNCETTRLNTWLSGRHAACPDCGRLRSDTDRTVDVDVVCQCTRCDRAAKYLLAASASGREWVRWYANSLEAGQPN